MLKYTLQRLLVLPVILFLVSAILFFFILQLPLEQRVQAYLPAGKPTKTAEEEQRVVQAVVTRYGLDQPFPVQYVKWLNNLAHGDLGFSKSSRQSVFDGLRQRAPATLELMLFALGLSVALALVMGELAARNRNHFVDYLIRGTSAVTWAFPPFILGLILLTVLYAWSGWFPPERLSLWARDVVNSDRFYSYTGMHTLDALLNGNPAVFADAVRHLVLPVTTLALVQGALLVRVMRSSMLEVLSQDYITTARAKGVRERRVINLHARRNAILPVISTAGVAIPIWLSSVVVVEVIFRFDGVGYWATTAAINFEIPVVVGFVLFSCTLTVLATLLTDILYAAVDPRVRVN